MGASDPLDKLAVSNDLTTDFMNKIESIYAHDMQEITECLEKMQLDSLNALRTHLFEKLRMLLPEIRGELYSRRKSSLLASDVFIIGLCVVSKAKDKRLKGLLRPTSAPSEQNGADLDPSQTNADLLTACTTLKTQVDTLSSLVQEMGARIEFLEEETTLLKVEVHNRQHQGQSDGDETDVKSVSPPKKPNSLFVRLPALHPISSEGENRVSLNSTIPSSNPIVSANQEVPSNTLQSRITTKMLTIQGSAKETLSISAAKQASGSVTQVYVGNLSAETSVIQLKEHLTNKVRTMRTMSLPSSVCAQGPTHHSA